LRNIKYEVAILLNLLLHEETRYDKSDFVDDASCAMPPKKPFDKFLDLLLHVSQ